MASEQENGIDVDELDSAVVAAAMGFSSFGAQVPPNKKRRFNPQADAIVGTPRDGRPPARLPPNSSGTGANVTRLTPRPVKTVAPSPDMTTSSSLPLDPPQAGSAKPSMKLPPPTNVINTDEIDLDDAEEDGQEDQDTSGGVDLETDTYADGEEPGPQYLDTSRPIGEVRDHLGEPDGLAGDAEVDPARLQARIDAVVAAGNATYGVPPAAATAAANPQLDGAAHSTGPHRHGCIRPGDRHGFNLDLVPGVGSQVRARDAAGNEDADSRMDDGSPQFGSTDSRGEWQGRGQGQGRGGRGPGHGHGHSHGHGHQRDWWAGYYDLTSNENPWARIEDKLGLPPCGGSWLRRGHARAGQP
ncbi:hypothetical protein HMPREF1624_06808 [Sporothrix schenckii ATCC 58251]|uniref:Uncharacterized protein n=1 Tax=Sporothrix schenckii (strain ATCC 58251 / de Perez 2211183) TaxID=1391915 RepID=U7PPD5_SPOS1|nr:hypothetical protein HMPREF1624_06808 [Sporothrix schenckii ATCC 58251]